MKTSTAVPPKPKGLKFKPLDIEFSRHGQKYTQIKRQSNAALYEVRASTGGRIAFEVVKIKIAPAVYLRVSGSWVPDRETYPSDEEFGTRGWCYSYEQMAQAEAHYLTLSRDGKTE